jgi:uncharacterized protein (DUF2252 family)
VPDQPPSRDERRDAGRAARTRRPRRELADWDATARPRRALDTLQGAHPLRVPELLPIRYERMASSPWAYLRGAAGVMASDLATRPSTGITVQICGDAHALNFGLWATPERNLSFAVRDFDETHVGPFEWDVLRLATSLMVLARENGFDERQGRRAVRAASAAYRERMREYRDRSELDIWYDRIHHDDLSGYLAPADREQFAARIERKAARRTSAGAFDRLTTVVKGRRRISDDPPFRTHVDEGEQQELLDQVFATYRASVAPHVRVLLGKFTRTDVVRQVVGVGSVGMRVFLVLVEGWSGQAPLFLQVKQAGPSVYEDVSGASPFANHGERVVAGQRAMQPAPDLFLGWTTVDGMDFYVRQWRDMKVIPAADRIAGHLVELADACGHTLAKAHARTGDPLEIASYLGKGNAFDDGVTGFAVAYADQTVTDHAELVASLGT